MNKLTRRLRSEDGFTLVAVIGIMTAVMAISVASFAATDGDILPGANDKDRKEAYAAAEAGIADYLARLTAKPDYWRGCATDTTNASLMNAGQTPRKWAPVAAGSQQAYSVELLPANGNASCLTSDPVGTFIDSSTGTFRIRATGRARPNGGPRRSIIATFRRRGFLDYIYYTDFETQDPRWLRLDTTGLPTRENTGVNPNGATRRDVEQWATEECRYWNEGRGDKQYQADAADAGRFTGTDQNNPTHWEPWNPPGADCGEIQFYADSSRQDKVNGPLHTNDHLLVCGNPRFGRKPSDDIEVTGTVSGTSWRQTCSGTPEVNNPGGTATDRGTLRPNAPRVELPPSNNTLKDEAMPGYRFSGKNTITLTGTTMHITGFRENGTAIDKDMPLPKDGVIYVSNSTTGTCPGYDPRFPYAPAPACGDVWLSGNYARNLTINADNDIIVQGNVTASGADNPLLGLISNNWIRVYHPMANYPCSGGTNEAGTPKNIQIEAAILSLRHSFAVDNYWCGESLGTLKVTGAIAQKYRGIVGSGGHGYTKDYIYNEELRFRSPPKFLDPVQSTWRVRSQVEQVPAAT